MRLSTPSLDLHKDSDFDAVFREAMAELLTETAQRIHSGDLPMPNMITFCIAHEHFDCWISADFSTGKMESVTYPL